VATLSVHLRCLLPRTAACRHWRHLQTDDQHFLGFECFGSAVAKLEQAIRVIDGAVTGELRELLGLSSTGFPSSCSSPTADRRATVSQIDMVQVAYSSDGAGPAGRDGMTHSPLPGSDDITIEWRQT
jgi:hypothetical protein